MKNKIFQKISRKLATVLCVALLAGCGNAQQGGEATPTAAAASVNEAQPTEAPEPTEAAPAKINDKGRPIADYYEYVNGDWLKEQEGKEQDNGRTEAMQLVCDRVKDILENTDVSTLSEDDGLCKIIRLYRELVDTEDSAQRMEVIRAYLKQISSAASLNDLYKLYGDKRYSINNYLLRFEIHPDENGYNEPEFLPARYTDTLLDMRLTITEGTDTVQREQFLAYTEALGYSEQRILEMIDNAMKIEEIVEAYYEDPEAEDDLYYAEAEDMETNGVTVPVFEILRSLNALGRYEDILAQKNIYDTLKKLYVPENLQGLKDLYQISAINGLRAASGFSTEGDEPDIGMSDFVISMYLTTAADLLSREYMERYMQEGAYESAEALIDEFRNECFDLMKNADWLGSASRSAATGKFVSMAHFLGNNGHVNEYEEFQISGNTMEDYISYGENYKSFLYAQTRFEDQYRQTYDMDPINVNGFYNARLNAYVVGAGVLCNPHCAEDAAYEEKLGFLGALVAHEMAHALDPEGIEYDRKGYYEPWLDEEEKKIYDERARKIAEYFDGMEIEYGRKLDGELVTNESFADLLSIKLCLRLLEKREDADYDLFFRTYAEYHRQYVTEAKVDGLVANEHVPEHQRVNCILAQFDKFYEVYEIDESSPYFVPEGERLQSF